MRTEQTIRRSYKILFFASISIFLLFLTACYVNTGPAARPSDRPVKTLFTSQAQHWPNNNNSRTEQNKI